MTSDLNTFSNANVLIIGGAGFIGSSIANVLVDYGAKITILDTLAPLYGGNLYNLRKIMNKVSFVVGDMRDIELLEKLVKGKDFIFDLVAQVSYIDSLSMPFEDLDLNVKCHLQLLETIRKYSPNAIVGFAGSRMQYGKSETPLPINEGIYCKPISLYGIHKQCTESYFQLYAKEFGTHTFSMRITNPYGPRQQMKHSKYSIVGWFLRMAMENKTFKVFGDGNQVRDYIYIDDIVKGFLYTSLSETSKGEIYNLGSGIGTTFIEMIKTIIKVVGKGKFITVDWPDDYRNTETGDFVADISKLKKEILLEDPISLEEGLSKMYKFYSKNKKMYF